jgi:hypothetical protein
LNKQCIACCWCRLFEYFVSVFDELIRDARKEGQFDSGIVDIKASTIELNGSPKVCNDPLLFLSRLLRILNTDILYFVYMLLFTMVAVLLYMFGFSIKKTSPYSPCECILWAALS